MYNLVELFSGIGSQAKALKNLNVDINTVGTSEWDIHALVAYDIIHRGGNIPEDIQKMSKSDLLNLLSGYTFSNTGKSELDFNIMKSYSEETLKKIYAAVRENKNFVDISKLNGKDMPDNIDIMTYSFPCQDLSNVGAFHGYTKGIDKNSGSRSSLLWQVGRILTEMKENRKNLPRFLLMENVPTLLSPRHVGNFTTWMNDLQNLGYISQYYPLNSSSFGLPQNRPRLLMISVYVGNDQNMQGLVIDYFKNKNVGQVIEDYRKSPFFHQYTVSDLLRNDYSKQKYFEEAVECTPNDTVSRRKIWEENPQLVLEGNRINTEYNMIRTVTTKQDRNPNSGNLYFDSNVPGKSKFRYLTPRECLLFMGFTDADYENLKAKNSSFHTGDELFSRDKIIRMAGNSIPVKLLEGIFLQILQLDDILQCLKEHPYISRDKSRWSVSETAQEHMLRIGLNAHKIRMRKTDGYSPERASVCYPKYRTAVYVMDPFWHTKKYLPAKNHDFWDKEIDDEIEEDKAEFDNARKEGWNLIVLWNRNKDQTISEETIDKIAMKIHNNFKKKDVELIYMEND